MSSGDTREAAATFIEDTLRTQDGAKVLIVAPQHIAREVRALVPGEFHERIHRARAERSRGVMVTHIVVVGYGQKPESKSSPPQAEDKTVSETGHPQEKEPVPSGCSQAVLGPGLLHEKEPVPLRCLQAIPEDIERLIMTPLIVGFRVPVAWFS